MEFTQTLRSGQGTAGQVADVLCVVIVTMLGVVTGEAVLLFAVLMGGEVSLSLVVWDGVVLLPGSGKGVVVVLPGVVTG